MRPDYIYTLVLPHGSRIALDRRCPRLRNMHDDTWVFMLRFPVKDLYAADVHVAKLLLVLY